MYFIGRVTLFFANNSLMQCRITMEFLHHFSEGFIKKNSYKCRDYESVDEKSLSYDSVWGLWPRNFN